MLERFRWSIMQMFSHLKLDLEKDCKINQIIAIRAYRMEPHRAICNSTLMIFNGQKALMPQEVPFVKYKCKDNYEKAVKE